MVKSNTKADSVEYNHAPISLFPTPFPSVHYLGAQNLQSHLGVMINDLVRKPDQIHDILQYFKLHDELMQKMLKVSEAYQKKELRQETHACILRSDYMIDSVTDSLKLVEYNTVASSFGCLCQKVTEVQNLVRNKYADSLSFNYTPDQIKDDGLGKSYIKDLASTFKDAVQRYHEDMTRRFPDLYEDRKLESHWVLFVIDKEERNICDQKWIEYQLYHDHGIKSMRMTFTQIGNLAKVDENTNALSINDHEIAFVYYRTGYQLEQYENEKDWQTREMLETTMPIKCPSIDVHLTTFKKFQQAFGDERLLKEVMNHHLQDADIIKQIFKGIWTLEDIEKPESEVQEIIRKALDNPHDYVIKPQKEGGGNNFYDDQVKELLEQNDKEYLKQFLIMERINPPEIKAFMLRNGKLIEGQTLSEFGVFSSIFISTQHKDQHDVVSQKIIGRLLRTKGKDSNEGGVNAGFAVIDSPLIVDIDDIKNSAIKPLVSSI
ncbi:glutathione synthetase [Stylonychia lemnae]|uniref:Glutathione synthetase n=1 Tax=Stylonychia lemnae TaxID=5949 RepID=A0A078AFA6_STYLE|nr:glutathione synthetase [Stylonychia lemnae]|eukprot:CDW80919.1 glutathione synthetase [Stylonychia lemnae]